VIRLSISRRLISVLKSLFMSLINEGELGVHFSQRWRGFLKPEISMPLSMPLFKAINVVSVFSQ
jgi:hypothetical protein